MLNRVHARMHAAFTRIRRAEIVGNDGLTFIELLVVVLIIGIRSAIAIPAFLGQQNKSRLAAAKSERASAKNALAVYSTANCGAYTNALASLTPHGYVASPGVSGTAITLGATAGYYCIQATSAACNTFTFAWRGDVVSGAFVAADSA